MKFAYRKFCAFKYSVCLGDTKLLYHPSYHILALYTFYWIISWIIQGKITANKSDSLC